MYKHMIRIDTIQIHCLKLTASSPLKMDDWNMIAFPCDAKFAYFFPGKL